MKTKKTPETFQDALKVEFKRFGLKKKDEELYLRLQEKKLIVDDFVAEYGFMGKLIFAERCGRRDPVWDDLKTLSGLQGVTTAELIPGFDEMGNVNPIFFLPSTPKNLTINARKLEKTLLTKREIEIEGNRGERK